ncbi:MAG: hypothetical protein J5506_11340 [Prevotella sp.]|nr:hypothetical protein [Prevotella sp.]
MMKQLSLTMLLLMVVCTSVQSQEILSFCGNPVWESKVFDASTNRDIKSGKVTFDKENLTMTFEDVEMYMESFISPLFVFAPTFDIVLKGTNVITLPNEYQSGIFFKNPGNYTIRGDGSLQITTNKASVRCIESNASEGDVYLTVSGGCSLDLAGAYPILGYDNGPNSFTLNLKIDASTVHAKSLPEELSWGTWVGPTFCALKSLTLVDCAFTTPAGAFFDEKELKVVVDGHQVSDEILIEPTTGESVSLMNNVSSADAPFYSLDGRQLRTRPQQRGVYIRHGHKVVVK